MSGISRVALAGKGLVGSAVVPELVKAGFKTTVLSRSASLANLPPEVEVRQVDYSSGESLQRALQDQDALVSTVTPTAIPNQKVLIDAAIGARVKHFIPADYSMVTTQPEAQWLPAYSSVVEIQRYLQPRSNQIDWTVICCGALVEMIFEVPFVIDFNSRTAELYNGGDVPVSVSRCSTIAKAIAGVLQHPKRVRDHSVFVHDSIITQKATLEMAKKYTPAEQSWTVTERDAEARMQEGVDRMNKGDFSLDAIAILMAGATWSGKYRTAYKETDNDWLGVVMMGEGELEERIRDRIMKGQSEMGSMPMLPDDHTLAT